MATARDASKPPRITPKEYLCVARHQASRLMPYASKGLFAMTFIEMPPSAGGPDTIGIDDKWRVYYNPAYVEKCQAEGTLIGEVLHELSHPLLRHKSRGAMIGADNHHAWNQAGDAELDQRLEQIQGLKLVEDRVTPELLQAPRDLTAEEYYAHILRHKPPPSKHRCGGGSGTGAGKQSWEIQDANADKSPAGISEGEADLIRAGVAADIKKHVESKGHGSVPAGWLRWAEEFLAPQPIDWGMLVEAQARYIIDSKSGPAPSYARPSRRQFGSIILPVHRMPVPTVTIVGDTSGSMVEDDIGKVIGVVYDAVDHLGKVTAIGCDAAATEPVDITHIDDLREALRGGGGTSMTTGIEKAAESNPDLIVVVTDGETDWPDEAPEVPVLIVLTRNPRFYATPDWAQVIHAN